MGKRPTSVCSWDYAYVNRCRCSKAINQVTNSMGRLDDGYQSQESGGAGGAGWEAKTAVEVWLMEATVIEPTRAFTPHPHPCASGFLTIAPIT